MAGKKRPASRLCRPASLAALLPPCRGRVTDQHVGAIKALAVAGRSVAAIARKFRIARTTATRWLQRETLPSTARPAPPLTKDTVKRRKKVLALCLAERTEVRQRISPVRRCVRERYITLRTYSSAAAIARQMNNDGWDVSKSTVTRDLHALGLKCWRSGTGPVLSEEQRKYRVIFCRRMLRMSKCNRQRIMFSDEKWFDSSTRKFVSYWAPNAQKMPSGGYVQGGPKVLVLGFISRTRRRLCVIDADAMNMELYRAELDAYKAVLRQHIFQQDNASCHAALRRRGWFERQGIEVLDWPALSPDLNVIETLWAQLSEKVSSRAPFGDHEVKAFVREAWRAVPQSTVRGLCDEFDDRCRVCIEEEGGLVTSTKLRQFRARQKAEATKK